MTETAWADRARVRVRHATAADLDAVLAVGRACWRATYAPIAGEEYVERGLAAWWTPETNLAPIEAGDVRVAAVAGAVVGMCATSVLGEHLVVRRLYVLPSEQERGIGTILLETAAADAPAAVTRVRLSYLAGNERARRFYERLGFVVTGERTASPIGGPDDVWMQRPTTRGGQRPS